MSDRPYRNFNSQGNFDERDRNESFNRGGFGNDIRREERNSREPPNFDYPQNESRAFRQDSGRESQNTERYNSHGTIENRNYRNNEYEGGNRGGHLEYRYTERGSFGNNERRDNWDRGHHAESNDIRNGRFTFRGSSIDHSQRGYQNVGQRDDRNEGNRRDTFQARRNERDNFQDMSRNELNRFGDKVRFGGQDTGFRSNDTVSFNNHRTMDNGRSFTNQRFGGFDNRRSGITENQSSNGFGRTGGFSEDRNSTFNDEYNFDNRSPGNFGSERGGRSLRGGGNGFGEPKDWKDKSGFGGARNDFSRGNNFASGGNRNATENSAGGGGYFTGGQEFTRGGGDERAPIDWVPEERLLDELYQETALKNEFEDDQNDIIVKGANDQRINSWQNSGLHDTLIKTITEKCRYKKPLPIQAATIPQVLKRNDIIAKAETGSGKTMTFVLPIVDMILKMSDDERSNRQPYQPFAVILAPTRELAKQSHEEFRKVITGTGIRLCLNYGQIAEQSVISTLKTADIYVGTVGRLMDYQERGKVDLRQMRFFVVDEADQMLKTADMDQLEQVIEHPYFIETNSKRQTMLFSATMNSECKRIAEKILKKGYIEINANGSRVNKHIRQTYLQTLSVVDKNNELTKILEVTHENGEPIKTLIFVATKKSSDSLAIEYGAASINGSRPQNERDKTMNKFKKGEINVLVGTDVCARGLDIPHLDRVIIYDIPDQKGDLERNLNEFAHRIGRTGRRKEGCAYIFCDKRVNSILANGLIELLKEVKQEVPQFLQNIVSGNSDSFGSSGSGFGNSAGGFGSSATGFGSSATGFGSSGGGRFGSSGFGFKNESSEGFKSSFNSQEKDYDKKEPEFGQKGFGSAVAKSAIISGFNGDKKEIASDTPAGFEGAGKTYSPDEDEPPQNPGGFGTGFHQKVNDENETDY